MASYRYPFSRLRRADRQAIALLRAPEREPPSWSNGDSCFAIAHREAQAAGYRLLADGTIFVSSDELRLLAWLSLFQRRTKVPFDRTEFALRDALLACAEHLLVLGIRLPPVGIAPPGFPGETDPASSAASGAAPAESGRNTRGRVIELVRNAGGAISTRDLRAAGISRQHLWVLCKRGTLRRVGYGNTVSLNDTDPLSGHPAAPRQ